MPFETHELQIDASSEHLNARADRGVQHIAGGSRSFVAGLFDHDCVHINGQLENNPGRTLIAGDHIRVRFELNRRYSPKPKRRLPPDQHRGFSIVYEDDSLIVVEKSAELLTVPTDAGEPHTLQYRVNEHVRHQGRGRGAHVVHRLDRGVSGLLVFGKTRDDARSIQDQFRQRKPERQYDAVVAGTLADDAGEIRTFLSTGKNLNRFSSDDEDDGELAITHFQVVQRLPLVTHVTVRLETGRRNQIRVHMAERRHPIVGDMRYRSDLWQHLQWPFKRLALHASTLGFQHPLSDQPLRFESPLPKEMQQFLNHMKTENHPARTPPISGHNSSNTRSAAGRSPQRRRKNKRRS